MRRYLAVLLLVGCFFIIEGYGQETTTVTQEVYQEVYFRASGGDHYFSDIDKAINAVAPEGTLYIEGPLVLTNRLVIQKPMHVKFSGQHEITIPPDRSVFYLYPPSNIQKFSVSGMRLRGTTSKGITGWAKEILVKNGRFENCPPINLSPDKGVYRIDFIDCEFIDSNLEIDKTSFNPELHLYNNHFFATGEKIRSISLENNTVYATHNTFHRTTITMKAGGTVSGEFRRNQFTGSAGTITVSGNVKDLIFRENSFLREMPTFIRNVTQIPIDFKRNWWGDRKGSKADRIQGLVNTNDWALFEDFSRFSEDPYTLEDLREACTRMEKDWQNDSWLYDRDENNVIDLLDVFTILRMIE